MASNYAATEWQGVPIEDILLPEFEKQIQEVLQHDLLLYKRFGNKSEKLGNKIIITVNDGLNESFGMATYNGTLPTAGSSHWERFEIMTKNAFARLTAYDKEIQSTGISGMIDYLTNEWEGTKTTFTRNINRMMYGDATGQIAKAAAAATTVSGTTHKQTVDTAKHIFVGQSVRVANSGANVDVTVVTVDKTASTPFFTFVADALPTTAKDDIIYIGANKDLEWNGLLSLIGSTTNTVFGINRSTAGNEWFKPIVYSASGKTLSYMMLKQVMDEQADAGGKLNTLLTTREIVRAYGNLFAADMRWTNPGGPLPTGFKDVTVDGQGLIPDYYCPSGYIFGIDDSTFKVYDLGKPEFLRSPKDGSVMVPIADKAGWTATLKYYGEFACKRPTRNFCISGVDSTAAVVL